MRWTYDGTINRVLWIGGAQWAGKTTVAALLTGRYDLTHYHGDFHDARGHEDRRAAARCRRGEPAHDWTAYWTELTPQEMADQALAGFPERFAWVLDDLRALVSPHPIVADGWHLRPDLIAEVTDDLRRAVILVPTEEWRRHQAATLPRATRLRTDLPDPARARRNRLDRDRLLAADATARARAVGIRVVEVDGTRTAESIADDLADQFGLSAAPQTR